MKLVDKLKDYFTISEEEYYDDVEQDDADDLTVEQPDSNDRYEDYVSSRTSNTKQHRSTPKESPKVVDFSSSTAKPHVVFAQLSRFDDVGDVAASLTEKRIVILNLENADERETRRIIDFLYGVIFAMGGKIKRVATRTFVITPHNVPFTGELLDEISGGGSVTLF